MNEFVFYRNQIPPTKPLVSGEELPGPPNNMWMNDDDLFSWILCPTYPIVASTDLQKLLEPDGQTPAYPVEPYNVVEVDEHTRSSRFIIRPKATLIMPTKYHPLNHGQFVHFTPVVNHGPLEAESGYNIIECQDCHTPNADRLILLASADILYCHPSSFPSPAYTGQIYPCTAAPKYEKLILANPTESLSTTPSQQRIVRVGGSQQGQMMERLTRSYVGKRELSI